MNAKKKIWWAFGMLAMVLVVAGASVGITIAALQARVQTQFSVSYIAKNVEAEVTGTYKVGNGAEQSMGEKIVFNQGDRTAEGSFTNPPEVELGSKDYLELHYQIKNTGTHPFGVTLNLTGITEDSNLTVRYSEKYWNGTSEKPADNFNSDIFHEAYLTASGSSESVIEIGVRISLADPTKDASAEGSFTFDLDSATPPPVNVAEGYSDILSYLQQKFSWWDDTQFTWHITFDKTENISKYSAGHQIGYQYGDWNNFGDYNGVKVCGIIDHEEYYPEYDRPEWVSYCCVYFFYDGIMRFPSSFDFGMNDHSWDSVMHGSKQITGLQLVEKGVPGEYFV